MSQTPDEPHEPVAQAAAAAPRPLVWASWLVCAEGLVAIGFGIADAVHTSSDRVSLGVTAALFFVAYGIALLWCGRGMARLHRWARGPVLFSQLVFLGLAVNFAQAGRWALTVPLALLAAGTLAGMLAPASVAALEHGSDRRSD